MIATYALVALVALVIAGGLLAICVIYRRNVLKLRIQLGVSRTTIVRLRAELKDLTWAAETAEAQKTVARIVAEDPLERLWRHPARGQGDL